MGMLFFLQYMPKKPTKWGIKAIVLARQAVRTTGDCTQVLHLRVYCKYMYVRTCALRNIYISDMHVWYMYMHKTCYIVPMQQQIAGKSRTHTHAPTYTHTHAYTHAHMYMRIHTPVSTHTHNYISSKVWTNLSSPKQYSHCIHTIGIFNDLQMQSITWIS